MNSKNNLKPTETQFIGVLMGGCIGDVLGSYNENLTFDQIRSRKRITKEFINTKFTDDTELTVILAQYLIKYHENNENNTRCHSMVQTVHSMYQKIVKNSKRGYSRKTKQLLSNWHDCMPANNADTNGSVMRIAPLALIKADDKVLYSKVKNAIYCTHGENKDAIDTSFLHVKLIKYLLNNSCNTPEELYSHALSVVQILKNSNLYPLLVSINPGNKKIVLNPTISEDKLEDYLKINVTKNIFGYDFMQIKAIHCYTLVLTCFLNNYDKPINALIMAANIGGDTDTIAKIIGDLIGAKYGTGWIPENWKYPEHHSEITNLGKELWTLYSKK